MARESRTFDTLDPTDPDFCGTWRVTDPGALERGVAVDLEWNASGIILRIDGHFRIDDRGPGSSLGGAARLSARELELEVNGSFSGTETKRKRCRTLAREFKQVAHQWTAIQCLKGALGDAHRLGQSYCEPEHANDLFVEHDDGTMAQHAHLQHGSFQVQPGDRVRAGQRVAASGDTGIAFGPPHLHFEVYRSSDSFALLP